MGLFTKKPNLPFAEDLNRGELAAMHGHRTALTELREANSLEVGDAQDLLAAADALISWWHRQPEETRIDPNHVVNAAGIALGNALATELGLESKIITDAYGTDLGLWGMIRGRRVILSPTHTVAKRFADADDGMVRDTFESLVRQVKGLGNGD